MQTSISASLIAPSYSYTEDSCCVAAPPYLSLKRSCIYMTVLKSKLNTSVPGLLFRVKDVSDRVTDVSEKLYIGYFV